MLNCPGRGRSIFVSSLTLANYFNVKLAAYMILDCTEKPGVTLNQLYITIIVIDGHDCEVG